LEVARRAEINRSRASRQVPMTTVLASPGRSSQIVAPRSDSRSESLRDRHGRQSPRRQNEFHACGDSPPPSARPTPHPRIRVYAQLYIQSTRSFWTTGRMASLSRRRWCSSI